MQPTVHVQ